MNNKEEQAKTFSDTGTYPEPGQRVRVVREIKLDLFAELNIAPEYSSARQQGTYGKTKNFVPGFGGDVWFVENEDGSVAVYAVDEIYPAAYTRQEQLVHLFFNAICKLSFGTLHFRAIWTKTGIRCTDCWHFKSAAEHQADLHAGAGW